MKFTCVLGSPRPNGNSAALAKRLCDTAEKLGAEVHYFPLNKLQYRGCQGCMACKTKLDRCILKDDLTAVLDSVREADVLVLASPTYYGDISSQAKAFMDRTYSYFVPDFHAQAQPSRLPPGKKLVLIQTQRQADESKYADILPRYEQFFKRYGFQETILLRVCGVGGLGEAEKNLAAMQKAEEAARKIMGK